MKRQRHWTYHEEKVRAAVLVRDNYECQIRGPDCTGSANTVDHIHPKAWGGRATPDNLRAACWNCNQRKGARAQRKPAFFRGASDSRAPLQKLPPLSRWGVIRSDYSRREPADGDSAA